MAHGVVPGGGVGAAEKIGPVMILIQIQRVQGAVDLNQVGEPKMNWREEGILEEDLNRDSMVIPVTGKRQGILEGDLNRNSMVIPVTGKRQGILEEGLNRNPMLIPVTGKCQVGILEEGLNRNPMLIPVTRKCQVDAWGPTMLMSTQGATMAMEDISPAVALAKTWRRQHGSQGERVKLGTAMVAGKIN
jgi:hypothetical protein